MDEINADSIIVRILANNKMRTGALELMASAVESGEYEYAKTMVHQLDVNIQELIIELDREP